ncbi:Slx4p interacting protein, variant 2 [Entomophthora muscae]|uniref:Slx4p interacting protein, variant 2 n=1 Tax=Entomophthora muscae TaxID=34485 RepID=A0ACC2STW4_9FUNG|nr:Slx4p interacting protein, variant 2 [Entomophthora muscae]
MGEIACGAHQTLKKRPWEIAILVYGFPSHLSALQFEWAWQKPHLSRYINRNFPGIYHKKTSEQFLPTKLRVLVHLLQCSGFSRWPLNLHFLISQVQDQFNKNLKSDPSSMIPNHIPITFGSLNLVFPPVAQKPSSPSDADPRHCYSCQKSGYQVINSHKLSLSLDGEMFEQRLPRSIPPFLLGIKVQLRNFVHHPNPGRVSQMQPHVSVGKPDSKHVS